MADEEHAAGRVDRQRDSRRSMKRPSKDEEEVAEERASKKSRSSGSDDEEGQSAPTTSQEMPSPQTSKEVAEIRKNSVKVKHIEKKNEKDGFVITVKVEGMKNRSNGQFRPALEFSELHRRMTKFRVKGIYVPKLPTITTKMSGQEQCDALTRYLNHLIRNDEVRRDLEVNNFLITPTRFDPPQESAEEVAIIRKAENSKFAYQVRDLYEKLGLVEQRTMVVENPNPKRDAFGRTLLDHELMLRSFFENGRGLFDAYRDDSEIIETFGRGYIHFAKREYKSPLLGEQDGEFRSEELDKALRQYFQDMTDARAIHNYQANSTINTHVAQLHYRYVTLSGDTKTKEHVAKVEDDVQKTIEMNAEFDRTVANEIKEISVARFNEFLSSVFKYGRENLQLTEEQVLEVFSASDSNESIVASPVVDAAEATGLLPRAEEPAQSGTPAPDTPEELAKRLGQAKIPKQ